MKESNIYTIEDIVEFSDYVTLKMPLDKRNGFYKDVKSIIECLGFNSDCYVPNDIRMEAISRAYEKTVTYTINETKHRK